MAEATDLERQPGVSGLTLLHDVSRDHDIYRVPMRPVGAEPITDAMTGAVHWRSYLAHGATPLAAIEQVANEPSLSGLDVVLDCTAPACGGFAFRVGIETLPVPLMVMNPTDFHQRTLLGRDAGDRVKVASLLASRFGGETRVQVVTVTEHGTPPLPPQGRAEPEDGAVAPSDSDGMAGLLRQIEDQGRIVLDDIVVDSAGQPTAESLAASAILDRVAALMAERPSVAFVAVGHSDGVGQLQPNMRLSRQRAEAVVEALVARGVPRDRLSAEGAGWLAPVTSNETPEGRATNRRVELVVR